MGFFWDIILAYGSTYTGSMTVDQWNTVNTSVHTFQIWHQHGTQQIMQPLKLQEFN